MTRLRGDVGDVSRHGWCTHSQLTMMADQFKLKQPKPRATYGAMDGARDVRKKEKFNFEKMKAGALSDDPTVRKAEFIEYFERFNEFPSFLFDNEKGIDPRLAATMRDLSEDAQASKELLDGLKALTFRLPS